MWLITPIGFFSIVQKPGDAAAKTLTIRARVKADLVVLRDQYLPQLGEIEEHTGTDYQFRATAPREAVTLALSELVMGIDYCNFKNAVAERQGYGRANVYSQVWHNLYHLDQV